MAPRLRQEPYNSDAVDADSDGIVQEGTAFERPAGTQIVDEFRRVIENGRNSLSRSSGWGVVDSDGNSVSYKPTYADTHLMPPTVLNLDQIWVQHSAKLEELLEQRWGEHSGNVLER